MSIDIRQLTIQSITPANAVIIVGDTLEVAMGKAQGQISANVTAIGNKADKSTTLSINGVAFDMSANRSWTIAGGGTATTDASQLTSGTLPDARLSSNIAINLTPTAIKTAAYTAAANELVKTDATSAAVPITLPTAPADKTRIAVKMIAVSGSNTTTISRGGTDVFNKAGGSTTITLTLLNQSLVVQYEAATGIWSITSGDIPLSGLDARFASQTQLAATTTQSIVNALIFG